MTVTLVKVCMASRRQTKMIWKFTIRYLLQLRLQTTPAVTSNNAESEVTATASVLTTMVWFLILSSEYFGNKSNKNKCKKKGKWGEKGKEIFKKLKAVKQQKYFTRQVSFLAFTRTTIIQGLFLVANNRTRLARLIKRLIDCMIK